MVKPIALGLRVLAIFAVMIVRVVAAVVEALAELAGIAAYEVLVPALRGLQNAQEKLEHAPPTPEQAKAIFADHLKAHQDAMEHAHSGMAEDGLVRGGDGRA